MRYYSTVLKPLAGERHVIVPLYAMDEDAAVVKLKAEYPGREFKPLREAVESRDDKTEEKIAAEIAEGERKYWEEVGLSLTTTNLSEMADHADKHKVSSIPVTPQFLREVAVLINQQPAKEPQ